MPRASGVFQKITLGDTVLLLVLCLLFDLVIGVPISLLSENQVVVGTIFGINDQIDQNTRCNSYLILTEYSSLRR